MIKYLIILLLPFILFAAPEMKCEAGKCSQGKDIPPKNIPEKVETQQDEVMKCAAGKCSTGKEIPSKPKLKRSNNTPTIEQLFNVKTVAVREMNTAKKHVNYGYIVAQDSLKVDVTAWYSGFVQELYADTMYKKVMKGDALVKVYSPEVYKAKQDYLNSINYNRKTKMPEMLQSAKTKLILLGVHEKEIQQIQKVGDADVYTTIYAPIDGWVVEKKINKGSSFTTKKKLFQIVNLDKVWMEVKLFQEELQHLKTLDNFTLKTKGIEKTYQAKKSLLYPMIDPKEATATLRLEVDNSDGALIPGMYAKVYASAQNKSRLVIPRTATIRKNGTWYAFLATEFKGEYEPVKIKVKPLDNMYYEVTHGLDTTDTIVNNALFMMDSDAQINSIY